MFKDVARGEVACDTAVGVCLKLGSAMGAACPLPAGADRAIVNAMLARAPIVPFRMISYEFQAVFSAIFLSRYSHSQK